MGRPASGGSHHEPRTEKPLTPKKLRGT